MTFANKQPEEIFPDGKKAGSFKPKYCIIPNRNTGPDI